jgi:hypothetical protein
LVGLLVGLGRLVRYLRLLLRLWVRPHKVVAAKPRLHQGVAVASRSDVVRVIATLVRVGC